jgi:Snare region anchored in the vesicle membrane C-terminus
MTTQNNHNPNKVMLEHADDLQRRSAEAAYRCQLLLNETEELGTQTLDELQKQRHTISSIQNSTESTDAKLDHTHKLLNRFDRWAGHWYGRNKRMAEREGKQALKELKLVDNQKFKNTENRQPTGTGYNGKRIEDMKSELFDSSKRSNAAELIQKPEDKLITSPLDDETKEELQQIDERGKELDNLLTGMAESLDRLSQMSTTLHNEATQSSHSIDKIETKLDQVNQKQFVAQRRLRLNLNK